MDLAAQSSHAEMIGCATDRTKKQHRTDYAHVNKPFSRHILQRGMYMAVGLVQDVEHQHM